MGVPCKVVRPCIAVPHEKPHIPSLSRLSNACRSVGSMPLGLFTVCLAWVSTCSLCFERGDSDTWGFHAQVSAHAWLSPTRNYTLEVCCTIQMDLCTDCVPQGLLTLWIAYVNTYLLSFNRGDSHAWGSMQSCPAIHSCPPWETTHPKFVPSFKCM